MAAFSSSSFLQNPFFIDSSISSLVQPSSTINKMCGLLEVQNNSNFHKFYQNETLEDLDPSTKLSPPYSNNNNEGSVLSVTCKNSMDSSSIVTDHKYHHEVTQKVHYNPTDKNIKRKSQANSAQSKDKRGKKQKKMKDVEEKKNKSKENEEEEAPKGYIHVRARRGQATDSHSLAERVRRERISERMKLLQALVPGCDKVTGKALMLDEIINYVQSLQNQVEFLSMKLASVNPMLYDFGMDLESYMVSPDQNLSNLPSPLANMHEYSPNNYHDILGISANSMLFPQAQIPNAPQENKEVLWEVEEQRQRSIINQSGLISNNLFSFH